MTPLNFFLLSEDEVAHRVFLFCFLYRKLHRTACIVTRLAPSYLLQFTYLELPLANPSVYYNPWSITPLKPLDR